MAYAIELRDVGQWLDLDTPVAIAATGEWEIKFRIKIHAVPNRDILSVFYTNNSDYFYYRVSTGQWKWNVEGSSLTLNATNEQVLGEWLEVSLKQTAIGGKTIEIPSLGLTSSVRSDAKITTISKFGGSNDVWAADIQFELISYYSDLIQTTFVNNWDAAASSHAAGTPILVDTVSGNNATATAQVATDGSVWIDLDVVLPVTITTQPLSVTELEDTAWTLASSASDATSSEWYKDGSPTGNTTDTIGGTGLVSESGDYYNLYTNGVAPLATNTVAVLIQAPFTEIISTTDVKLGESFTITTNGIDDLTAATTIAVTYGGISLSGESNATSNTVDFLAPVSGLELGANHNLVITVDGVPSSNFTKLYLAPTGYAYVTLVGINEHSWLASPPYSGNGGSDSDNIGVDDQIVYPVTSSPSGTDVVVSNVGIVSMPNGVADGVITDQTISWFYLEAQEGYISSNSQTLTLVSADSGEPGVTSIFSLVNTGTPDGTYATKFYDDVLDVLIVNKDLTFLGGNATTTLDVTVGNAVHSLTLGDNAPTTGMAYVGVTE